MKTNETEDGCHSPPLPWWRRWLGIGCGCWCSLCGAINSATRLFLFRFRLPTLARSFAQTMQKAKVVWLAVVTTFARLGLQGAGFGVFCIFPADVGDAKGLFASRRRVAMRTSIAKTLLSGLLASVFATTATWVPAVAQQQQRPNIVIIWGDDIGTWNISHNNRGMMGYMTPNIDRLAREGVSFTDYYGQQSCTAGRAAFIGGTVPVRTGMTKVGLPGAKEGWQKSDPTIAALLKDKGYATGQFGKNHFGDLDEHLPTMHGFDEYFGSLYHLNASEEPENEDYPQDPEVLKRFGPRGVIRAKADGKGGQSVEDTGPLTKKRMETIDEETMASAKEFITRQKNANKPFFCWWNATRMHFRTHVKAANRGKSGQDEYSDGMVEHDAMVGELLKLLDDLGIANDTIVFYSTDNGPHYNAWPDAGTTQFRSEKNSNWEGAYRVPAFVRWPGQFQANTTLNGLVAHEDWMVTLCAAAGMPDVKDRLMKGDTFAGRQYRSHPDGYNMLDYLSGKTKESPRKEFWYVNDDGQIVAARYNDWKVVVRDNSSTQLGE